MATKRTRRRRNEARNETFRVTRGRKPFVFHAAIGLIVVGLFTIVVLDELDGTLLIMLVWLGGVSMYRFVSSLRFDPHEIILEMTADHVACEERNIRWNLIEAIELVESSLRPKTIEIKLKSGGSVTIHDESNLVSIDEIYRELQSRVY